MKISVTLKRSLLAAAFAAVPLVAQAQGNSPLVSTMEAYLVQQDASGNEVLKPAEKAQPDQVIEYRLKYSNQSDEPISGLAVTGPIPESTVYLPDTAYTEQRSNLKVSIDGGKTWDDEPVLRMRENANGEMEQVVIPPSEYTHVRWYTASPLMADSDHQYSYRVQIQ